MSIAPDFLQLLVHPVYKTPLQPGDHPNELSDHVHPDRFKIKDGVPVLLTDEQDTTLSHTERHDEAGTSFRYKEHYQHDAEAYDYTEESQHPVEREEIRRLRSYIAAEVKRNDGWLLDVGCGGAWLATTLVPEGMHVISMDISDINPLKARKRIPQANHQAVVADVFELPFRNDSISQIVASEIIEHVPDPKKFVAALYQVLKPGGRLVITTPYNEFIRTSLCIHCNHLTPHNAHLHSFTEKSILKYLPADARTITLQVFNSKLLVKTQLQKMLAFLPVSVYKIIDKAALAISGKKAYRLMAIIEK